VLFARGDPATGLVVVAGGRLKVSLSSRDGTELLLRVAEPGDTLGEPSIADGGTRSADVTALHPSRVLLLDREAVLACVRVDPVVLDVLLRTLGDLVRRRTDECADLVFLDLRRRVAKLLLAEAVDGRVGLDLSQSALAAMVGGSRQAVNVALRALEQRGWIAREQRRVVLLDQAALQRFVGI
jgi:CRP/FNR family transcriptional regulator, cyclic AMP receptor protein